MTQSPMREASSASCALLADRHCVAVDGIRDLLGTAFGSVYMVGDSHSLIEGAQRLNPDVIVFDISFASENAFPLIEQTRRASPFSKLIILTIHDQEAAAHAFLSAGADAVVLKRCIARDLMEAVDAVSGQTTYVSGDIEAAN